MSRSKSKSLVTNWHGVLSEMIQQAEQVAHTVQRERKMSVVTLVQSLVLECLTNAQASLADFVQTAQQLGTSVTSSSFDERLTPRLVGLLVLVFQACLQRKVALERKAIRRLTNFKAVYLIDSTQVTVAPSLYQAFQGIGNTAKMKVHLVVDFLTGGLQAVDCVAGRSPDQKNRVLASLLGKGMMYLFDLGYFQQELLQAITTAEAFFVTRCQSQVGLYDPHTQARVRLSTVLSGLDQRVMTYTATYQLGNRVRTPVRIVARRLDQQQADKRRQRARKKARKAGQRCSEAYLTQLGWDVLVTNLDATWTVEDVFILYRIRWQIEIIFKVWKSQLGVAALGNWRAERVMCQFYAHLIGIFLCHASVALVPEVTSFPRAVQVIQHHVSRLIAVIRRHWSGIQRWARELWLALTRFAQQDKRKQTPTTLQVLINWGLS